MEEVDINLLVKFLKFYSSFGILRGRHDFYSPMIFIFSPLSAKELIWTEKLAKIVGVHESEILSKWILLTGDHFDKSWEVYWLFQCYFEKVIFENPKICKTSDVQLLSKSLSSHRPDLNLLCAATGGLKLFVDVKNFWKKNKKLDKSILKMYFCKKKRTLTLTLSKCPLP